MDDTGETPPGRKHTLAARIGLSLVSLLVFLCLLEGGLRLAGRFYTASRRGKDSSLGPGSIIRYEAPDKEPGGQSVAPVAGNIVLCVGDSYTFGGLSDYEHTYPVFLQGIIDEKGLGDSVKVINGGVCEYNSRQVLIRLPELLKKYHPNVVVLLVGSANRFNLAGFDPGGGSGRLSSVLRGLRVFKMGHIIAVNLKGRYMKWRSGRRTGSSSGGAGSSGRGADSSSRRAGSSGRSTGSVSSSLTGGSGGTFGPDGYAVRTVGSLAGEHLNRMSQIAHLPDNPSPVERFWFLMNTGNAGQAVQFAEQAVSGGTASMELLCSLGFMYGQMGNIERALELLGKARTNDSESYLARAHQALIFGNLSKNYVHQNNYDSAVEYLLKAIEADPLDHDNYYYLVKSYELQNRFSAREILQVFDSMLKVDTALKDNELYVRYSGYFRNRETWEIKIETWLAGDLEDIASVCRKNGVQLVVQNYPYPHKAANKALAALSGEYRFPFVDNCSHFSRLTAQEHWQKYFLDDDHCTPQGHAVMARNVYDVLGKSGLLPGGEQKQQ